MVRSQGGHDGNRRRKRDRSDRARRRFDERQRKEKSQAPSPRRGELVRKTSGQIKGKPLIASFEGLFCLKKLLDQVQVWRKAAKSEITDEALVKSRVRGKADRDRYQWVIWLHSTILREERIPADDVTLAEIRQLGKGRLLVSVTTRSGRYNWEVPV